MAKEAAAVLADLQRSRASLSPQDAAWLDAFLSSTQESAESARPRDRMGKVRDERLRVASMMDGRPKQLREPEHREEVAFLLDGHGQWISTDDPTTWEKITQRPVHLCQRSEWVGFLDPSVLAHLHEAFLRMTTIGGPFSEEIALPSEGEREWRGLLTLTPFRYQGQPIQFVRGLLQRLPQDDAISPKLTADPLSENNRLAAYNQFIRKTAFSLLGLGIISVCGAMVMVPSLLHRDDAKNDPLSQKVSTELQEDQAAEQEAALAKQVIHDFLSAPSLEERARHILGGSSKRDRLQHYYQDHDHPVAEVSNIHRWDIVTIDDRRHYAAQGTDVSGQRFLAMVDLSGPQPKLNWEALVGYCEMPYEEFVRIRPSQPTLMRLLLRPDDYYNHAYSDSRRYACFALESPDSGEITHAYIDRASANFHRLAELFPQETRPQHRWQPVTAGTSSIQTIPPRRVTLSLSFHPENQETAQAQILEVHGEEWVYVPRGERPHSSP